MAIRSSKTMFVFKSSQDQIEDRPFAWERYAELADNLSNDQLIEFVIHELDNFQSDQRQHVSTHYISTTYMKCH